MTTTDVQGLVLNDAHGLALKAEGDLAYTTRELKSGFFSSIAEKADALRALHVADESDNADSSAFPVVRLETSSRVLLVSRIPGDESRPDRTIAVSKQRGLTSDE